MTYLFWIAALIFYVFAIYFVGCVLSFSVGIGN